ncbi:MAG TPA: hypothetical protein VGW75_16715, partial [Solirubrobacteraceae bacterium]|nr:hypothetical protein [Solirubrobacteraceae bacterium]
MSAELRVAAAHARGILDSRARVTVEAEVTLASGASGRGSAPAAIAPGRRERARSEGLRLGPFAGSAEAERLCRSLRGARLGGE